MVAHRGEKQLDVERAVGGQKWSVLEFLVKLEMSWTGEPLIIFLGNLRKTKSSALAAL